MTGRGLKRALARFGTSRRGNVATIFALSAVPAILLVGASVDYTRSVARKTSLQQATDATALAAAHELSVNASSPTLSANAHNYFSAAVDDPAAWIDDGPTVSADNTAVCLTGRTKVPTTVMRVAAGAGLVSADSVTVKAASCAKINNLKYEIAMVLDNSGSMNESTSGATKMDALITASKSLVSVMNPAGATPRASFSLVPFSLAVNVGPQYRTAPWIDGAGQSSIVGQNVLFPKDTASMNFLPTNRFALFDAMGQSWAGCVEERVGAYLYSDAAATPGIGDSLYEPYLAPDETSKTANKNIESSNGYSVINDYLKDKTAGGSCSANDIYWKVDNNKAPAYNSPMNTSLPRGDGQTELCKYNNALKTPATTNYKSWPFYSTGSGFATGPNLLCDSKPITPLTNDATALNNAIAAMSAKGSTNLFSGVMWGWHTLSPYSPYNSALNVNAVGSQNTKAYGTQGTIKYLILMTDGFNSWNSVDQTYGYNHSTYSPFGYFENSRLGATDASNWRSVMDTATLKACTNAKAQGVQIFTVGFSIPSDPIDQAGLNLLQGCASTSSMAYIAQDGSSLISTFQTIAAAMSGLRITN